MRTSKLLVAAFFFLLTQGGHGQPSERELGTVQVWSPSTQILLKAAPGGIAALRRSGYAVEAQVGNIASLTVSQQGYEALANDPAVIALAPVKHYRPLLDQSVPDAGASDLRSRFRDGRFDGITGRGVVVAVVDSGIDWRHNDFRKPDGRTRIRYLWDPSDTSYSDSGGGVGLPPPPGGKGTVYNTNQINAALMGLGTVNSEDECGHGSHVAGIAAGNGSAGGNGLPAGTFVGMAPEADLIVVRVFDGGCRFLYQDISLIQAMEFVDQKAGELDEPYALNFSLGTRIGGHDGTSLEEIAIDSLVAPGAAGKTVVVAAGNDGMDAVHVGGNFGAAGSKNESVTIGIFQENPQEALFDFWFDLKDSFRVTLSGGGQPAEDITDQVRFSPLNNSKRLLFSTDRALSFDLTITGETVKDGRFDGWVEGNASFTSSIDHSRLVNIPGTARKAITVGAHTTKLQWTDKTGESWRLKLASLGAPALFTSPGPTRDGRLKPELSAPGQVIASTLSSDATSLLFPDFLVLADERHAVNQGTSMSAPHVTGAVALLFEQMPYLDAGLVREILTASTREDSNTGETPNPTTGFGKLDAGKAIFPEKPRVVLSANYAARVPGERVELRYALQRGRSDNFVEGWVALRDPMGSFKFLSEDGKAFTPTQVPYRPWLDIKNQAGLLFSTVIPDDLAEGAYTFYAVGIQPGEDPFDPGAWVTNLAKASVQIIR
jgi:subtilisin family serine protease